MEGAHSIVANVLYLERKYRAEYSFMVGSHAQSPSRFSVFFIKTLLVSAISGHSHCPCHTSPESNPSSPRGSLH